MTTITPRLREFVRAWLTAPGNIARVAIEDGTVKGYGVLRPCTTEGPKIAPLFATSVEVAGLLARALVAAIVSSRASAPVHVFIDVPEPNNGGVVLAERLGLSKMWETSRMYRLEVRRRSFLWIKSLGSLAWSRADDDVAFNFHAVFCTL